VNFALPSPNVTAQQQIVVGIDGSHAARHALAWAFAEAEQRGAELDVVTVWDYPYQWAVGFNTKWVLRLARHADLLVVGSRCRGGFKDLLLGSVSSACVHHTPCPIAVIPDSTTTEVAATAMS